MDGQKSYIVKYLIEANVDTAATNLTTLQNRIKGWQQGLTQFQNKIQSAATSASNALKALQDISNIQLTVTTTAFEEQLKAMEVLAGQSANRIRTEFYRALTASGPGKKAMQRSAVGALGGTVNLDEEKKAVQNLKKEIEKIQGVKGKNGRYQGGILQGTNLDAKSKEVWKKSLVEKQNELATREGLIAKEEERLKKIANAGKTRPYIPAKEDIKAWQKFAESGKGRRVTISVVDKASDKIAEIKGALEGITIKPIPVPLDPKTAMLQEKLDAFKPKPLPIRTKLDLTGLRTDLSKIPGYGSNQKAQNLVGGKSNQKVPKTGSSGPGNTYAPPVFGKPLQDERNAILNKPEEQRSYQERRRLRALNRTLIQSQMARELTSKELESGLRAQRVIDRYSGLTNLNSRQQAALTKAQKTIGGLKSLGPTMSYGVPGSAIPPTTPPLLPAQLPARQAAPVNPQQALSQLQGQTARMLLTLDPTPARAVLTEFVAEVRSTVATMKLNATTGGASGGGSKSGKVKKTPSTNNGSGYNPGPKAPYIWKPEVGSNQRAAELLQMRQDAKAAFAKLTPFEQKEQNAAIQAQKQAEKVKKQVEQSRARTAPSGFFGSGKNRVFFGTRMPDASMAPDGYQWTKTDQLANRLTPKQANAYNEARNRYENATRNLAATRQRVIPLIQAANNPLSPVDKTVKQQAYADLREARSEYNQSRANYRAFTNGWMLSPDGTNKGSAVNSGSGRGSNTRAVAPVPFYDRVRKWGYPFAGNTSFGARTPMAVEMAKGMGVMFAIGGAMGMISNSFSQAMEYQHVMESVKAIQEHGTGNFSLNDFKNMEKIIREVGVKTKFSAPEVANAALFLSMAGQDMDAINNSIQAIADLAIVGDIDLGETADKMTNIMSTFNIPATELRGAGNIMTAVTTATNTTLPMLAESFKYAGNVVSMFEGANNPNLFADTAAIFGILGNAGIQGSMAGTSTRMMYLNLMSPNNKQSALQKELAEKYHIKFQDDKGNNRDLVDILIDMKKEITNPAEMSKYISKMFRITAQPTAAKLLQDLGIDPNNKDQMDQLKQLEDGLIQDINDLGGFGGLIGLIQRARAAKNGNMLGEISEKRQNTATGLLARVTSTFTEGIVKAFEQRQGGIEGMLKDLADYLAKPETVRMLQNLLDLVIEIGKVMTEFVKIWAKMYSMAPGLIQVWATIQMVFTQMGSLIAPFIQLAGVLNRFGLTLSGLGAKATATTTALGRNSLGMAASGGAYVASMTAPIVTGKGKFGLTKAIRGKAAAKAHAAMQNNYRDILLEAGLITAAQSAPLTFNPNRKFGKSNQPLSSVKLKELENKNIATRQHYEAVQERYNRRFFSRRSIGRNFTSTVASNFKPINISSTLSSMKMGFMGLLGALSGSIASLINPVTLAIGVIGGLAFGIYKFIQNAMGLSDTQIAYSEALREATDKALAASEEGRAAYDQYAESLGVVIHAQKVAVSEFELIVNRYDETLQKLKERFGDLITEPGNGANRQATNSMVQKHQDQLLNTRASEALTDEQLSQVKQLQQRSTDKYKFNVSKAPIQWWNIPNLFKRTWNIGVDWWYNKDNQREAQEAIIPFDIAGYVVEQKEVQDKLQEILNARANFKGTPEQYKNWAIEQAKAFANVEESRFSVAGLSPTEFNDILPYIKESLEFRQGILTFFENNINQLPRTVAGQLAAKESIESNQKFSEDWFSNLDAILQMSEIWLPMMIEGEKVAQQVKLNLKLLPNGAPDFQDLYRQLEANKIKGQINIRLFTDALAQIYKAAMSTANLDIEDIPVAMNRNMSHLPKSIVDYEAARQYFIANYLGKDNVWTQNHFTPEKYGAIVSAGKNPVMDLNGTTIDLNKEREKILTGFIPEAVNSQIKQKNKNASKPTAQNEIKPNVSEKPHQDAYSSNYQAKVIVTQPSGHTFNFTFGDLNFGNSERGDLASLKGEFVSVMAEALKEALSQA